MILNLIKEKDEKLSDLRCEDSFQKRKLAKIKEREHILISILEIRKR